MDKMLQSKDKGEHNRLKNLKKKDSSVQCLQKIHFRQKDTSRFQVKV